jgi:hypothetical protein
MCRLMRNADPSRPPQNCRLHPLIHTGLESNLAQDIEKKKAEQKTPHFLGINQDIVAWSQEGKCGLKYVIYTPGRCHRVNP